MDLVKVPKNVLERIFNYLPHEDLLNLALVCKHFNKIISESSLILSNFDLHITDYENREWIGTRKYQNVHIIDCREDNLQEHNETFETIKDSVNEVVVRNLYQADVNNFSIFLNQFEFLTKLSIFSIDLWHESFELPKEYFDAPKFKCLEYLVFDQSEVKILKIFSKSKLKYFKVSDEFGDKEVLVDFLINQSKLEIFEISYFDEESGIFEQNKILNVKFKLKKLVIKENKISNQYHRNLVNFLELQRPTLQHFEVNEDNYKILEFLKDFTPLKTLRIFGGSPSISIKLPKMNHIQTLHLDSKLENFNSFFPNLLTLKTNTQFINLNCIGKLQHIRDLEIHNAWDIPIFKNRNICSLKLVGCIFQDVKNFDFSGNKLETLVVQNCYSIDWLREFLLHKDQKLNVLKLLDMKIEHDQLSQKIVNTVNGLKHKTHTVICSLLNNNLD